MNPEERPPRPRSRDDFEIAIICALPLERNAVEVLLEKEYETGGFSYGKAAEDLNAYTTGRLGNQHVVLAYMPSMGMINSAAVAANLRSSFRGIRLAMIVGVCGGVPTTPEGAEILLGDIIVSMSVIQIDFGRQYPNMYIRKRELEDTLGRAAPEVRAYIGKISGYLVQKRLRNKITTFSAHIGTTEGFSGSVYPGPENDKLYPADYRHKHRTQPCGTCEACNGSNDDVCETALQSDCETLGCGNDIIDGGTCVQRALGSSQGGAGRPAIRFGRIACSNTVMKSGVHRDRVAAEEKVIGFEMESAGAWEYLPTIVIKSVCDYSDSHKNKQWQAYAAATAAACTKAMLEEWRNIDRPARDAVEQGRPGECSRGMPIPPGIDLITNPVHWTVTRSPNTLFVGRNDLLDELGTIVREAVKNPVPQTQCRIVISGIGGQGKSELCLQLAHRARTLFWGVFWVDVSTRPLAENGFLDIANRLKVPAKTWEDGRQGLTNVQQPWILVLDNADDPKVDYQDYFPPGPSGVVVLTSRNHECQQYATARYIDLEGLTLADSRELLLKAACVEENKRPTVKNDADKVAELLHSHALALIQAGAYVARGHCTLAKYPEVYRRQRKRLLTFRPNQAQSRYRDVYATFEASVEILDATSTESTRDALELLPMLAVCGPNQIPLKLFDIGWKCAHTLLTSDYFSDDHNERRDLTNWHMFRLPSVIQANAEEWDSFRLTEALQMLKAFALISVEEAREGDRTVSMHPLVHAWARDRQDDFDRHESWLKMCCLIAVAWDDRDFWSMRARQLQPHIHAVTSWDMQSMFGRDPATLIVAVFSRCGWILQMFRDDNHLSLILERLFSHLNLDQLKVSERWVKLYQLKGLNLEDAGRTKEAIGILTQVVGIDKCTLKEEDRDRLTSMHKLARVYEANGQINDALALLQQVVEIQKRIFAEEHPDRLDSLHELAIVYEANGQINDALALLEQVVEIRKRILAEEHPDRLASIHALATVYEANGQIDEALALLQQVVDIEKRTLGEEHPDRLASMHELARAYRANGQTDEALALIEQVVEIEKRTLGEEHPNRLTSEYELAIMRP
ncbi:Tetratricopeptide repeat-containing protein isoform 1 [Cladophialophora immunda]|nr:Tetratricopeptide repeat-containing protein isoform 1 [Cladophialophora immunda]